MNEGDGDPIHGPPPHQVPEGGEIQRALDALNNLNDQDSQHAANGDIQFDEIPALGPTDGGRMELSDHERQWALDIKEEMIRDPELDVMSDYDIAQIALVDQGDTEAAIDRAYKMQGFKMEFDVIDEPAHGRRILQQFMDLFPDLLLCFSYSHPLERYVVAMDGTKFDAKTLKHNPQALQTMMCVGYYIYHALNPDFESIRQGVILLAECGGFCWTQHLSMDLFKMITSDFISVYPVKWNKIRHFHTSLFFNLVSSMAKPLMPSDFKEVFEVGCVSLLGRLDEVYLTPTREAATERFKDRLATSLQRRYQNASEFTL
ncbi:expressed unknown protein [Seminavis robusta]|uniref:CRAL-TRIO domain-containing protein n=1 Tax=Seminavis robusta TaxID=568900 RepID=A0A9N8HHC5_9STRA|nr:expressed unknown protein [Seminavis robusta]|eukprot:Sro697_g189120.1 n/a (317) ;mRNA; r:45912-46862